MKAAFDRDIRPNTGDETENPGVGASLFPWAEVQRPYIADPFRMHREVGTTSWRPAFASIDDGDRSRQRYTARLGGRYPADILAPTISASDR